MSIVIGVIEEGLIYAIMASCRESAGNDSHHAS